MGTKRTTTTTGSTSNQFENFLNSISKLSGSRQQTLDPTAQQNLNQLYPQIQQAINLTNKPTYGEAQTASYLGGLNELANASINSLRGKLARTGGLTGGQLSQGATDLDLRRLSEASRFTSQIPFLNRQSTLQALPGLFGAQLGAIGQAPRGETFEQTNTQDQTQQGSAQGQQYQQSVQKGSWLDTLLGILGASGQIGGAFMGMPFLHRPKSTGDFGGETSRPT